MLSRRSAMAQLAALGLVSACGHPRNATGPVDFSALDARMAGDVLIPGAAEYDAARRTFTFSPRFNRHPAAVARCANADDIARAIEFARKHGLDLSVRSGGHDMRAASVCDNGLVIDLRRMNATRRSETGSSITVGAGAQTGAVLEALAPYGQVAAVGDYAHVGISGLTLGGGLGPLVASLGAACDHLLRARLVTVDGVQLTASKDENPDLFWALRGGGGNFGVVTELELAPHKEPPLFGGLIMFDGAPLADFLHFFPDYMAKAPRELVAEARVIGLNGRPVIMVVVVFAGSAAAAARVLKPLRAFARPLVDGLRAGTYASVRTPTPAVVTLFKSDRSPLPEWDRGGGFEWKGGSINAVSDGAIKAVLASVEQAPAGCGWAVNLGHHMHGAVCEVGADTSPLPRPKNNFTYHFDVWWGDAAQTEAGLAWLDASAAAFAPFAVPSYVNYLSTDDPASIAAAYGGNFARLRGLKRRYDPDNVLHHNRNIPPA